MAFAALMTCCSNNSANQDGTTQQTNEPVAETLKLVYDDDADPMFQLGEALSKAQDENKLVIVQLGGNWCIWCLRFADFITKDAEINKIVTESFVYVHINAFTMDESGKRTLNEDLMASLGNPERFGYPVLVILNAIGEVIHIQDSALLEDGDGYNREMVKRFFEMWTPDAVAVG